MTAQASEKRERITWLHYEFAELIARFKQRDINSRELASLSAALTTQGEIDSLDDDLLQHTFWAMQHVTHRPACWAPTEAELDYVLRCLREEEIFDAEAVEFTLRPTG